MRLCHQCLRAHIAACIVYVNQVTTGAGALAAGFSQHVETVQLDCNAIAQTVVLNSARVKHHSAASELHPELWCAYWLIFSVCQSFVSATQWSQHACDSYSTTAF